MVEEKLKQEKKEEKKTEIKKQVERPKREMHEAVVYGRELPISTRHAISICRFIKKNSIEQATAKLEQVVSKKQAVPFRGEIPHRKGMASGRYPVNAAKQFIKLLKNLAANASVNGLDLSRIAIHAKADVASRTRYSKKYRRFKRTNVTLIAKETAKQKQEKEQEKIVK
jgi:large subunit ribosomal protein L22